MRRVLLSLLLLAPVPLVAARDNTAVQKKAQLEVQDLLNRMSVAESAFDAAALARCYEDDGLLLPSSGQPVKGRDEIAKRYQAMFASKTPRPVLESEELWVLDDLAVSRGATRGPAPRRNVKGPVKNRYVMTIKRHGEAWEVHSLVWGPSLNR